MYACADTHIRPLLRSIGDGRLDDAVAGSYASLRQRQTDPPEVIAIKQIADGILAKRDHEMRRRCAGHIHQQRPGPAQIEVQSVKIEPVERRPIIAGRAAKDRSWLKANHCFALAPCPARIESVTRSNEWISAITGNSPHAPCPAADR